MTIVSILSFCMVHLLEVSLFVSPALEITDQSVGGGRRKIADHNEAVAVLVEADHPPERSCDSGGVRFGP
jgi:hypothetical protein